MGYRSMKTKRYIVLAFILSLVSSISSSQIRVNLTDTILKSGSATAAAGLGVMAVTSTAAYNISFQFYFTE